MQTSSIPSKKTLHLVLKVFLSLFFLAAIIALIRDTASQGTDFYVFWRAAVSMLTGEPVYSTLRDGPMVIKYPPWTVSFFIPIGFLPFEAAKWVWGIIEVLCIAYTAKWVSDKGCVKTVWIPVLISFWGIWAVHALDGQCNVVVLAIALFAFNRIERPVYFGLLVWILSMKVFLLFALLGVPWKKATRNVVWKSFLPKFIFICILLTLPALWAHSRWDVFHLIKEWMSAASSGGVLFDSELIRARQNQGLPAAVLRVLEIPAKEKMWDFAVYFVLAGIFGGLFYKYAKKLGETEKWVTALALSAAIHPLAWFHMYVYVFPLACFATYSAFCIDRSFKMKLAAIVSILLMVILTKKTVFGFGDFLEIYSGKALGVVLAALVIILISHRSNRLT